MEAAAAIMAFASAFGMATELVNMAFSVVSAVNQKKFVKLVANATSKYDKHSSAYENLMQQAGNLLGLSTAKDSVPKAALVNESSQAVQKAQKAKTRAQAVASDITAMTNAMNTPYQTVGTLNDWERDYKYSE